MIEPYAVKFLFGLHSGIMDNAYEVLTKGIELYDLQNKRASFGPRVDGQGTASTVPGLS